MAQPLPSGVGDIQQVVKFPAERQVPEHATDSTDDESGNNNSARLEGLEALATLSALGVSDELRSRVQEAIQQLEQLQNSTTEQAQGSSKPTAGPCKPSSNAAPGAVKPGASPAGPKVQTVEAKLQMSRNIMRKLHHKNVALEKELHMYKANTNPITFSQSSSEVLEHLSVQTNPSASKNTGDHPGNLLVVHALQERDEAILQLRHALDASRRSNALLENQLAAVGAAVPKSMQAANGKRGTAGRRQPVRTPAPSHALHVATQQSQVHANRYKQIRNDYNHLLNKRANFRQANKAEPGTPQAMLADLKARLTKEMSERDAEAAMYSTRLYESERHVSDWYVEKRMLEEHITKLNSEIIERDNLDQQIQSCVCGLFERVHLLEAENAELHKKLESACPQLVRSEQ